MKKAIKPTLTNSEYGDPSMSRRKQYTRTRPPSGENGRIVNARIIVATLLMIGVLAAGTMAFAEQRDDSLYIDQKGDATFSGRIKDQTGFVMPAGAVIMWSGRGDEIPEGWALCDGREVTINGVKRLTPNLVDRFVMGAGSDYDGNPLNPQNNGGRNEITLAVDQMPEHKHTAVVNDAGHGHKLWIYTACCEDLGAGGSYRDIMKTGTGYIHAGNAERAKSNIKVSTEDKGGKKPINILPPFFVMVYIMKL